MKKGVVYSADEGGSIVYLGRIIFVLKTTAAILRKLGLGCIVIAVSGLLFVYIPLAVAEARYAWQQTKIGHELGRISRNMAVGKIQERTLPPIAAAVVQKPDWEVPDESYSIYIPKITAVSRVISNVDAYDKETYMKALQQGVAEASGLSHPGQMGTTFLFAHSVGNRIDYARYNAVFYLLDKLEVGDPVEVMYKGKLLKYQVWNKEILPGADISYLQPQNEEEKLVLQTCYPPGTTWKRLVVTAKRT